MSNALLKAWQKTVRYRGDDRAVTQAEDGHSITFRELDARAAAWLTQHAPPTRTLAGRAVVFAVPNGIQWLEIFLGLLRAGAVAVPLDATEPVAAQVRIAAALRAGFRWDGQRLVALDGPKNFRDAAVCLIKLTSGSTGQPRPLVFTAEQVLADSHQVTTTMGIRSRDLNYALIPFGHSYGIGNLTVPLIAQGVPLVCGGAPLPHAIATDFVRWRPSVFPSVPAVWRALVGSDVKLASLRLGISAGASLAPEVANDFAARFGRKLHNFYGSSETGGITYDRSGAATLKGGVGRAMNGVTLSIRQGQRLQVKSAAVFTNGNRNGPSGGCGMWIMPDHVNLDTQGQITLIGRRGHSVKIAGRRVDLGEVASHIKEIRGVRDAWVGISSAADPQLGAVVATECSVADLRTALHTRTSTWKIPKKWLILTSLPTTARGKTDTKIAQKLLFG